MKTIFAAWRRHITHHGAIPRQGNQNAAEAESSTPTAILLVLAGCAELVRLRFSEEILLNLGYTYFSCHHTLSP